MDNEFQCVETVYPLHIPTNNFHTVLECCILMFINFCIASPKYCFIMYTCGLTVVIKRICYVMLC